jgi:hypothetical protein
VCVNNTVIFTGKTPLVVWDVYTFCDLYIWSQRQCDRGCTLCALYCTPLTHRLGPPPSSTGPWRLVSVGTWGWGGRRDPGAWCPWMQVGGGVQGGIGCTWCTGYDHIAGVLYISIPQGGENRQRCTLWMQASDVCLR